MDRCCNMDKSQKTVLLNVILFVSVLVLLLLYFIGIFAIDNFTVAYWSLLSFFWAIPLVYISLRRRLHPQDDSTEFQHLTTNVSIDPYPFGETVWYFVFGIVMPCTGMIFSVVSVLTMIRANTFGAAISMACAILCFLITWRSWKKMSNKHHLQLGTRRCRTTILYSLITLFSLIVIFLTICASIHSLYLFVFNVKNPPGVYVNLYPGDPKKNHMAHYVCTRRHGNIVVLLFHGLGGQALDWSWIQHDLANMTGLQVCSFDRSGYGWSDTGPLPRTSKQISEDLIELLSEADLMDDNTQFILVGHSMAGFNMLVFQHMLPNRTLGIACLDCVDTLTNSHFQEDSIALLGRHFEPWGLVRLVIQMKVSPIMIFEDLPAQIHWDYIQNILKPSYFYTRIKEVAVWATSAKETVEAGSLGDMPFLCFSAGHGINNLNLTRLSRQSQLVEFPGADHYLPFYKDIAANITTHLIHFINNLTSP